MSTTRSVLPGVLVERWMGVRALWVGVALMLGVGLQAVGVACAQESSGREVERLRRELEAARQEIRILKEENARLRGVTAGASSVVVPVPAPVTTAPASTVSSSPTPTAASSVATSVSGAPVTAAAAAAGPGVITIPMPVAEGTRVSAEQLLADYRTSALAGDARYKGRRVKLEGKVHSFKKAFVGLGWTVSLQSGDQLGLVRCQVSFPGISDFRPLPASNFLEGRRPFREWKPLLQVGETVVFEGVCAGVDDAVVVFKDCVPVVPGS